MEEFTKEELYQRLTPVLRMKKEEYEKIYNESITEEDIWKLLINNKWKKGKELMLSDIVHDIINIKCDFIHDFFS